MGKWFICQNEEVTGPFKEEDLRSNEDIPANALIWGHPLASWVNFATWNSSLTQIRSDIQELKNKKRVLWYFAVDKESFGPFPKKELISKIGARDQKDRILIWTKGYDKWVSIFECPDILQDLDINRRKVPRALISGHIVLSKDDFSVIAQLKTIGPGGLGCSGVLGLKQGDIYNVEIRSSEFHSNIKCSCEARYVSDECVGFRFENIHREALVAITDYVRSVPAAKAA